MQHVMTPDAGGQLGGSIFGTVDHMGMGRSTRMSVRFYMDAAPVMDPITKEERTEPRLHIEFPILGEPTKVRRLATERDKRQYADAWRAFDRGLEAVAHGTPLEQLPGITQHLVQLAALHGIRTVEDMTDERAAASLGMHGRALRAQCVAWLENKAGAEALDRAAALERATATIEQLQAQMTEMQAAMRMKDVEMRAMSRVAGMAAPEGPAVVEVQRKADDAPAALSDAFVDGPDFGDDADLDTV